MREKLELFVGNWTYIGTLPLENREVHGTMVLDWEIEGVWLIGRATGEVWDLSMMMGFNPGRDGYVVYTFSKEGRGMCFESDRIGESLYYFEWEIDGRRLAQEFGVRPGEFTVKNFFVGDDGSKTLFMDIVVTKVQ